MTSFAIGGRPIGVHAPVFSIAEIGLNHSGDLDHALALVGAAACAGATAINLRTFCADRLVAASCPAPAHVQAASLREFCAALELDAGALRAIVAHARARGLAVLSTPLAEDVVPILADLGIDAFKIASGDLTYDNLIAAAARTGKPLLISTGMSTLEEAVGAVGVARRAGARHVAALHCVSAYPTPVESKNLRAIQTLADALALPVGLSDHSSGGIVSAIVAVALGASIYERHLMLDDSPQVVDRAVSSTAEDFRTLVVAMERTRVALGDGRKRCQPAETPNVIPSRRGLYARRALCAGEQVSAGDVIALRPATAVSPHDLSRLVGATLPRGIAAGEPFCANDLALECVS